MVDRVPEQLPVAQVRDDVVDGGGHLDPSIGFADHAERMGGQVPLPVLLPSIAVAPSVRISPLASFVALGLAGVRLTEPPVAQPTAAGLTTRRPRLHRSHRHYTDPFMSRSHQRKTALPGVLPGGGGGMVRSVTLESDRIRNPSSPFDQPGQMPRKSGGLEAAHRMGAQQLGGRNKRIGQPSDPPPPCSVLGPRPRHVLRRGDNRHFAKPRMAGGGVHHPRLAAPVQCRLPFRPPGMPFRRDAGPGIGRNRRPLAADQDLPNLVEHRLGIGMHVRQGGLQGAGGDPRRGRAGPWPPAGRPTDCSRVHNMATWRLSEWGKTPPPKKNRPAGCPRGRCVGLVRSVSLISNRIRNPSSHFHSAPRFPRKSGGFEPGHPMVGQPPRV